MSEAEDVLSEPNADRLPTSWPGLTRPSRAVVTGRLAGSVAGHDSCSCEELA